MASDDHYILISADAHAGADLWDYKPYLEQKWHADFDEWAKQVEARTAMMREAMKSLGMKKVVGVDGDPVADADRNWNSERRLREQSADGWVAEVIFPNTQPPFAPLPASEFEAPQTGDDYERRFAGLQAHNRWLADYVSQAPERRAGCAQIFLGDVEGSVGEIEWAADAQPARRHRAAGCAARLGRAPALRPGLRADLVRVRGERDARQPPQRRRHARLRAVPARVDGDVHARGDVVGTPRAVAPDVQRSVRAPPGPALREHRDGHRVVARGAPRLDSFFERMKYGHGSERFFGREATKDMSLTPSEYWRRQCHVGASFLRPTEVILRHEVGIDNIMWGVDYPHIEGSQPYTRIHLRRTFAGLPADEVEKMVSLNAAKLYKFDLDALPSARRAVLPDQGRDRRADRMGRCARGSQGVPGAPRGEPARAGVDTRA